MAEKKETTAAFQERTFPARARTAKRKAKEVLRDSTVVKDRAKAERVIKAADRVLGRLNQPGGKTTTKKPKKKKSTPASRRKPIEDATGVGETRRRLEAVRALARKAGG